MGYKVGDMVVYPRHGAAKVEAITERTVKGVTREYLQLSVLSETSSAPRRSRRSSRFCVLRSSKRK